MMLVQGMNPQEAADCLGITLNTAKTHLSNLYVKTERRAYADKCARQRRLA